ncbi:MAG TPA: suppressor of fused domain protein [Pirellulales bacterium]
MSAERVESHLRNFWPDREQRLFSWDRGPILQTLPNFRVCRVTPPTLESWAYVSVGASVVAMDATYTLEFLLLAPYEDARHVETLAMIAWHHAAGALDWGRIVNLGQPWLDDSACDHVLVSLPYPYGPEFEWCCPGDDEGKHIRFLWLLPITAGEAKFAYANGVEALEQLFDQHTINSVDPHRKPVA